MKKPIIIASFFLIVILAFQSCKKHKYEKELTGKWSSSIDTSHACGYDKVIIEFEKNDVAYLNYSKSNINKWSTPCECKWWIEKKKGTLLSSKQWILYIVRYDTLCCACFPYAYTMPDTQKYTIGNINDNSLVIHWISSGGMGDLFFSESTGSVWSFNLSYEKKLYKQ